ncbi:hypothetical protein M6G65_01550 [Methylobacterium tardum]|uniref:hypothetical protein n=1 Tax=Methylobacterium tardum TaxID=374432 RepID=UPI0020213993|nr:hypothetical protein [Methylobacterium tardum]URD37315.1 hypothetical protein M6G65_01550 [Methylobacterium tardum]
MALCDAVDPLTAHVADLQTQIEAEIAARQGAVAAASRALDAQIQAVAITANQTVGAEAGYRVAHITQAVASVTAACTALVQAEADARAAGDAEAAEATAAVRARLDGLSRATRTSARACSTSWAVPSPTPPITRWTPSRPTRRACTSSVRASCAATATCGPRRISPPSSPAGASRSPTTSRPTAPSTA